MFFSILQEENNSPHVTNKLLKSTKQVGCKDGPEKPNLVYQVTEGNYLYKGQEHEQTQEQEQDQFKNKYED